MSARAVRITWLVLAVGELFWLRSRLLRPPRHRYSAVEGGQVVGLLGGDGLLPGVGLGMGGCGGWGVVAPDGPGQQGDGDERQAADEGQAVDDPAHGGCVLSRVGACFSLRWLGGLLRWGEPAARCAARGVLRLVRW